MVKPMHIRLAALAVLVTAVCALAWNGYALYRHNAGLERVRAHPETITPGVEPYQLFAWARYNARKGELQTARQAYLQAAADPSHAVAVAALFNLANLNMRAAIAVGADDGKAKPLLELAKGHYRQALRLAPQDWSVRYNLAHALRFAPEYFEDPVADMTQPVQSSQVLRKSRGFTVALP